MDSANYNVMSGLWSQSVKPVKTPGSVENTYISTTEYI